MRTSRPAKRDVRLQPLAGDAAMPQECFPGCAPEGPALKYRLIVLYVPSREVAGAPLILTKHNSVTAIGIPRMAGDALWVLKMVRREGTGSSSQCQLH